MYHVIYYGNLVPEDNIWTWRCETWDEVIDIISKWSSYQPDRNFYIVKGGEQVKIAMQVNIVEVPVDTEADKEIE